MKRGTWYCTARPCSVSVKPNISMRISGGSVDTSTNTMGVLPIVCILYHRISDLQYGHSGDITTIMYDSVRRGTFIIYLDY